MATEIVDTTWPEAFEDESTIEDSTTSRDYRLTWTTGGNPIFSFTQSKRISSIEEEPEFEPYCSRDFKEALSKAHTFFRLGTLLGRYSRFPGIFIHMGTGVVNGYIPEPKIEILVRVARDIVEKSKANGWWGELNAAIELAKTTYTSLRKIELFLEKDPEIPDRETLRFILTVSGDPEQVLAEEYEFKRGLESSINPQIREIMTVTYYWG